MKRFTLLFFICLLWASPALALDIHVLDIDGPIGPATVKYIDQGLNDARTENAQAVILRLNTPGGLLTSTRKITKHIMESDIPVIGFVGPKGAHAASAGTFILYACDIAAMAPSTNIGAATPITLGDDTTSSNDLDNLSNARKKILNDSIAAIRSMAEMRNRNPAWAEQAVRDAATLTETKALQEKVVDYIAEDVEALVKALNGRTIQKNNTDITLVTADVTIIEKKADWRIALIKILTDPNVAFLLLTLGFYGLTYEFAHPGTFFPGVFGSICLLLGLFAMSVLPVTAAGLILLFLGLFMMTAEAFVLAKGILGIGGAVAFVIGATLLFDSDDPNFRLSWITIASTIIFIGGGLTVLLAYTVRSYRRNAPGTFDAIGKECSIITWENNDMRVMFDGVIWMARSQNNLVYQPEETVLILDRNNLTLILP